MVNNSRIDIYDYLTGLMKQVTDNVYPMGEPTTTTESDVDNGFIVILVGDLNDDSEFPCEAYIWARCYITAYIPKKNRGILNKALYKRYEEEINSIIKEEQRDGNGSSYFIVPDSLISMDDDEKNQKNNQYYVFIKSFIVGTDYQE